VRRVGTYNVNAHTVANAMPCSQNRDLNVIECYQFLNYLVALVFMSSYRLKCNDFGFLCKW